jgi:hypothetical protein
MIAHPQAEVAANGDQQLRQRDLAIAIRAFHELIAGAMSGRTRRRFARIAGARSTARTRGLAMPRHPGARGLARLTARPGNGRTGTGIC